MWEWENGMLLWFNLYLFDKNTVKQINTSEVELFLISISHMYVFFELSAHDFCPFSYWGVALLKPPGFSFFINQLVLMIFP